MSGTVAYSHFCIALPLVVLLILLVATNLIDVVGGQIVVERSGLVLANRVLWAETMKARRKGLLAHPPLEDGAALVIPGAFQVHTFGMTYPIDVLFCSGAWGVRHVVRNIAPRRVTWLYFARYALELPSGAAADVVVGDRLVVTRP